MDAAEGPSLPPESEGNKNNNQIVDEDGGFENPNVSHCNGELDTDCIVLETVGQPNANEAEDQAAYQVGF